MERDNVLPFPRPDHDLSPEEFACEITSLTGELAMALSGREDGHAEGLVRIERASILLEDISRLVSRGRDRQLASETFERLMRQIAELRAKLRGDT
jgi:hypothetical protein